MTDLLDRRRFLRLGVVWTTALSSIATTACGISDSTHDRRSWSEPELLAVLGSDAVRALGQRYRAMVPAENDATRLRAAIQSSRPLSARLCLTTWYLARQIRADFDEGRTVIVDGWLLSTTEARQCALYSISRG